VGQRASFSSLGAVGFLMESAPDVRTALQSPWQSPYLERFVGTLRRELLDHVIVLNERHLQRLLREFIEEYYHVARPHQGLLIFAQGEGFV
jgi:hypothetical protein